MLLEQAHDAATLRTAHSTDAGAAQPAAIPALVPAPQQPQPPQPPARGRAAVAAGVQQMLAARGAGAAGSSAANAVAVPAAEPAAAAAATLPAASAAPACQQTFAVKDLLSWLAPQLSAQQCAAIEAEKARERSTLLVESVSAALPCCSGRLPLTFMASGLQEAYRRAATANPAGAKTSLVQGIYRVRLLV